MASSTPSTAKNSPYASVDFSFCSFSFNLLVDSGVAPRPASAKTSELSGGAVTISAYSSENRSLSDVREGSKRASGVGSGGDRSRDRGAGCG